MDPRSTDLISAIEKLDRAMAGAKNGKLPAPNVLARSLGIPQPVMKRAIEELLLQGRIRSSGRKGIEIAELSPAQLSANRYLHTLILSHRASGQNRLPTLRAMAGAVGVSLGVMTRTVNHLVAAGLLKANHRSGIQLPDRHRAQPPVTGRRAEKGTWRRTAYRIDRDILGGIYQSGNRLPGYKELMGRYGVCYETLQKALVELTGRGIISRTGRRLRVASWQSGGSGKAIVLVARGTPEGEFFVLSSRAVETLRILEDLCTRAGIELIIAVVNDRGIGLRQPCTKYASFADALAQRSVLGFIVWTMALTVYDPESIIRQLTVHERPIAVFDEGDYVRLPRLGSERSAIKVFSLAGSVAPGRHVGRYLLNLGHRRIAYVSVHHDGVYSQNRLTGLEREFDSAGVRHGVVPLTCSTPAGSRQENALIEARSLGLVNYLRREEWIGPVGRHRIPPPILDSIQWDLLVRINREHIERTHLYPLLDRLVHDRSITAIAAANDKTAVEIIHFLSMNNVTVPGDVSIIGFDNSAEASTANLTSYNFNSAAAMNAIFDHILNPGLHPWNPRTDAPVEIEGFINERESTGRAG